MIYGGRARLGKYGNSRGKAGFWAGRRVLVTGATGIVGSWLTQDLLELGAHVVALVLDADPQTELYRSEAIRRVNVVQGRLEDFSYRRAGHRGARSGHGLSSGRAGDCFGGAPLARSPPLRPMCAEPGTCWRPAAFTPTW